MKIQQVDIFGGVKYDSDHTKQAEAILTKFPASIEDEALFLWLWARDQEPKLEYLDPDVKQSLRSILRQISSIRRRRNEVVDRLNLR